jgi:hypothetical protein
VVSKAATTAATALTLHAAGVTVVGGDGDEAG